MTPSIGPVFGQIFVGSDHAGYALKTHLVHQLSSLNDVSVVDLGTKSADVSVDYPDFAKLVVESVLRAMAKLEPLQPSTRPQAANRPAMGLLICGSGQGMAMRANRSRGIRAALCWSEEVAELSRLHNDANVLCLGSRVLDHDLASRILSKFISTSFEGGRHLGRVRKIDV